MGGTFVPQQLVRPGLIPFVPDTLPLSPRTGGPARLGELAGGVGGKP
ncbi:hypothetical protein [Streptosporangium sp. NPDC006930]